MKVLLANPRGFCAGVERAIEIVERAIDKHGAPIYVRHEVVHNQFVVNNLKEKGAVFVDEIIQVPEGGIVVFSAHGVSQRVRKDANSITSTIYDATCPLVTKVHKEVTRRQKQNHQVILIGHAGHPEVEGTLGQSNEVKKIALVESIMTLKHLIFQLVQISLIPHRLLYQLMTPERLLNHYNQSSHRSNLQKKVIFVMRHKIGKIQ